MDPSVLAEVPTIKVGIENINRKLILNELAQAYWTQNRQPEDMWTSFENSRCYSLYLQQTQIGFARVITDFATFAYLCDVIVVKSHQRQGYGKFLLNEILNDVTLKDVNWLLRTKDAHDFYIALGFSLTHRPERYMERLKKPSLSQNTESGYSTF